MAMARIYRRAPAHLLRLLLVGRQDVSAAALSAAVGVLSSPVLPAVYALRAGGPAGSLGLSRLDAPLGASLYVSLIGQAISLWPWCCSYQRRSSGTQRARASRPSASVMIAVMIGPMAQSNPGPHAAAL